MRGYLQNQGNQAYFVMQRQIPPGGKVNLSEAYKSLGSKSGLEEGIEFVEWLKVNILTRGAWGFYEQEGVPLKGEKTAVSKKAGSRKKVVSTTTTKTSSKKDQDARGAGRVLKRDVNAIKGDKITPAKIVEAPYDEARALIEKCRDKSVLKKSFEVNSTLFSERAAYAPLD